MAKIFEVNLIINIKLFAIDLSVQEVQCKKTFLSIKVI